MLDAAYLVGVHRFRVQRFFEINMNDKNINDIEW
jgi:hypothetical protein